MYKTYTIMHVLNRGSFVFDEEKNRKNAETHGIDFEETKKLWEGTHVIIPAKEVRGENRSAILGKVRGRVYMAIFTERHGVIRLISCHRADRKWERIYHGCIKETGH
jgi:uncharacterized DUF497 family protein